MLMLMLMEKMMVVSCEKGVEFISILPSSSFCSSSMFSLHPSPPDGSGAQARPSCHSRRCYENLHHTKDSKADVSLGNWVQRAMPSPSAPTCISPKARRACRQSLKQSVLYDGKERKEKVSLLSLRRSITFNGLAHRSHVYLSTERLAEVLACSLPRGRLAEVVAFS